MCLRTATPFGLETARIVAFNSAEDAAEIAECHFVSFKKRLLRCMPNAREKAPPLAIERISNTCSLMRSPPTNSHTSYQSTCPRGAEYLRIIYGPEYLLPENLERLRSRNVGAKRSLASRESALGIEALGRFVRKEPPRLTHECVFGVLALESEPIDPRL